MNNLECTMDKVQCTRGIRRPRPGACPHAQSSAPLARASARVQRSVQFPFSLVPRHEATISTILAYCNNAGARLSEAVLVPSKRKSESPVNSYTSFFHNLPIMKPNIFPFILLLVTFALTGCGEEAPEQAHEEAHHDSPFITLGPAQRDAVDLTLVPLQPRNISGTVTASGTLEVPPQSKARISTFVGGNVAEILVIEGDKVQKGQRLALLEHPDLLEMQTQYQESWSRLQFLEQELARQQRLYDEEVGAGKALQQTESEFRSVQARTTGLEQKLRQLNLNPQNIREGEVTRYIPVLSPISGYVKEVDVTLGQYVPPQEELFEVLNAEHVHVDLMVFEKDVYKVREGQQVLFRVTNYPGDEMLATIYSVGKQFEEDPKAVHIHAEVNDKHPEFRLIPGMYVEGEILVDSQEVLALPEEAVVSEGEVKYIFVKVDEAELHAAEAEEEAHDHEEGEAHAHEPAAPEAEVWAFRPVEIITGDRSLGMIAVRPLEELPIGTLVAGKGAYYVLSEWKKGEAGHSH